MLLFLLTLLGDPDGGWVGGGGERGREGERERERERERYGTFIQ